MQKIGQNSTALWPALAAVLVVCMAVFAGLPEQRAWAQNYSDAFYVVVNPENPHSSAERRFLADAFLKKRTTWPDGASIHPIDQRIDAPARAEFSKRVLRRSVSAVKKYWQQRIFSGRGVPPPEVDSDDAVIHHVLRHVGAIGYVSVHADTIGVKVIEVRE